jgi:NADPH2:quinone reductase
LKAVRFYEFGEPNVLKVEEVDLPQISNNEVLIKVHGAGVNPVDAKTRKGLGFVAENIKLPWTPGYDVAGEIFKIGENVKDFHIGDKVFGMVGFALKGGCYAEYVSCNADEIVRIPENIYIADAAAVPLAALTAFQGLFEIGKLKKGERVLIHAGAGGVGHFAVQFAKNIGAYVISTASKENHRFLLDLGVDEIIDYRNTDFSEKVRNIDLVLDLMGFDIGVLSLKTLKKNGRIVTVPTITADKVCNAAKGVPDILAKGMKVSVSKTDLEKISKMIENNDLQIKISKYFSLEEATLAHEHIETGKTLGKIILKI